MIDTGSVFELPVLFNLFKLLALLEVIETTLLLNTPDPQRVQQLIITGFALIRSFGNKQQYLSTSYALLGLLLRPPFLNETEGTALCMFVQTDLV